MNPLLDPTIAASKQARVQENASDG